MNTKFNSQMEKRLIGVLWSYIDQANYENIRNDSYPDDGIDVDAPDGGTDYVNDIITLKDGTKFKLAVEKV